MKLTDLNRFGGVGANGHLVELGGVRILVDCGLHPKHAGREALPDLKLLLERPPDAVIVTHCHLDHLGALPLVLRQHPNIPAMLSLPSTMLAERLLRNSVNVMKREREEKNLLEYPLYGMAEVQAAMKRMVPMLFGQTRRLGIDDDEVAITFFPAGHVTGAAGIQLEHKHRTIFFTGDVQFAKQRLVDGARYPARHFDAVVTETTRGATEKAESRTREAESNRLVRTIARTLERGGSALLPVFALGRMQEIFLLLHAAKMAGRLPPTRIYAGGLGMDLCDHMDEVARKTGACNFSRTILRELEVKPPPRVTVPGREPKEQGIYVLSSGMMVEHTPSHLFASCFLGRPQNAICFVGYCDPETPGGRLLAAARGSSFVFEALNFQCAVRASIERFDLTGHADRDELLEFALQADPRTVILTHGDPPARAWFMDTLTERAPKLRVIDPIPGETYEI